MLRFFLIFMIASIQPAWSQTADETYCRLKEYPPAMRQTFIIVDGRTVAPELSGPNAENQRWRKFIMQFLNGNDPQVRQRVDARERVTVMIANADGSGLTSIFSGCVPLFRSAEEEALDGETSSLEVFFGNDWRSEQEDNVKDFVRRATLATVEGIAALPPIPKGSMAFKESGLAASLSHMSGIALEEGIPRIVIYTDLKDYGFPESEIKDVRLAARADAEKANLDLQRAEVHIFGASGQASDVPLQYLRAYFLSGKGYLATLAPANGTMSASPPPRSVVMYQGTVSFPDASHPLRMRLALDQSNTVVNSWVEMQSSVSKFVPFFGILSCPADQKCSYVGDGIFAQIWDDNTDTAPDLQSWQPFGGMRSLEFDRDGERIVGRIRDEKGYVVGREDGLAFTLDKVSNGIF